LLIHGCSCHDPSDNKCLFDDIFDTLPNKLFNELLSPSGSSSNDKREIGSILLDFRTIVIGDRPEISADGIHRFFRKPFSQDRLSSSIIGTDEYLPDANWASTILKAVLPFMEVPIEDSVPFSKYDFTASRFLDGRVMYITGLGPQPPRESLPVPLYGIYYWSALSRWQIGRLVDRLNLLGVLRLAAIMDVENLRKVDTKIDDIELELAAVSKIFDSSEKGATDRLRGPRTQLDGIHKLFAEIDAPVGTPATPSTPETRPLVDGGLEYRIERSRYYVKQWREGIKDLRILRIEGFQPYDSFVERRLGATFDYIHRLGLRYDRIKGETARLEQYYLAQASVISQDTSVAVQRNIEDLQFGAELALWVALLPYYIGQIFINHIIFKEEKSRAAEILWTILWGGFLAIAAWRFIKHRWKDNSFKTKVGYFGLFITVESIVLLSIVMRAW
jgi:hypothetical protein